MGHWCRQTLLRVETCAHHVLGVGGGYFQGKGQKKYCCVRGGHYMKNKKIGGCVLSTEPNSKKGPNEKMRKKCKKLPNIEKIFLARFAHSAFYRIHIYGAANRHAPVQYANMFFFSFL